MNNVSEAYKKMARNYEGILGSIYQFAPRPVDEFFESLPPGSAVLDAGCGPGFESAVGARRGHAMTGLDACDEMLERFRANVPAGRALKGDVARIPADAESFDAVFSSCVLLHLSRARAVAALGELCRVLKPGGRLLLVTNVGRGEQVWVSRPVLAAAGVDKLFFYNWDKEDLLRAVSAAGFEVGGIELKKIKPEAPELIFISAMKRKQRTGDLQ